MEEIETVTPSLKTRYRPTVTTVGHRLLGTARGDQIRSLFLRRWRLLVAWWILGLLLSIFLPMLPGVQPSLLFPGLPARDGSLSGRYWWHLLVITVFWTPFSISNFLVLDYDMLKNIAGSFTVIWMCANAFVSCIMMCFLLSWEPVFSGANMLQGIYMCIIPLADTQPERIRRKFTLWAYSFGVFTIIMFLSERMFASPEAVAESYDPVLLKTRFVRVTAAEVYTTASLNMIIFMFGLLGQAVAFPRAYTVWRCDMRTQLCSERTSSLGSARASDLVLSSTRKTASSSAAQSPFPMPGTSTVATGSGPGAHALTRSMTYRALTHSMSSAQGVEEAVRITPAHGEYYKRGSNVKLLGHVLFGQARGDTAYTFFTSHWKPLLALGALVSVIVIALPPDIVSMSRAWPVVVAACWSPFFVLNIASLDAHMMCKVPLFVVLWSCGNVLVAGINACVLAGFEPIFTVAAAMLTLFMLIIPFADSQPARLRRELAMHVYGFGCVSVAAHFTQIIFAPGRLEFIVQNPTLVESGFNRVSALELYTNSVWNVLCFMFGVLLKAKFAPGRYWLWGSRLTVERLDPKILRPAVAAPCKHEHERRVVDQSELHSTPSTLVPNTLNPMLQNKATERGGKGRSQTDISSDEHTI